MKKMKQSLALLMTLSIVFTFIPTQIIAQSKEDFSYNIANTLLSDSQAPQIPVTNQLFMLSHEPKDGTLIHSPSEITYNTRVSYEIVTEGKAGVTSEETLSAVVRFTLENPREQPVSFNYTVLSGSAEKGHLLSKTTGIVILSQQEPKSDVIIEIAPFADKPEEYSIPNDENTFWTGEHFFYLYCNDIKNALFDENWTSLTVPVPVKSEFDYEAVYENAVNTKLIDFNQVGVTDTVYAVPESLELKFTGEISEDIRKMLDDGVFTHIHLPQGYFMNESDENQDVLYEIKVKNPDKEIPALSQFISLEPDSQTSFYSDTFTQSIPVAEINLGADSEKNGIYNKIDFIFDYKDTTNQDAIFTSFSDEEGEYLQHQVSFSDEASPMVTGVSTPIDHQAHYGDEIPVTIGFSEPVYTDDITFTVDGQTFRPMERSGTISQKASFLYQIGDEALNTESFNVNITDISGAVDLSGKVMEVSVWSSKPLDISSDRRSAFTYCAEPSISLEQGTDSNMSATVSISLKQYTNLSNWLNEQKDEGNISTVVKARAITAEGTVDIPLTVQTDHMRVTGFTGSFTAPENNTGMDVFYALEIYLDTGSGYEMVDSLTAIYSVQPLVLVDEESDITLDYKRWPLNDQILISAGDSLSLGYLLNVNATWIDSEYFKWSSSDERIAIIDTEGNIQLLGTGEVFFTLTVSNPLNDDTVIFNSRILTVLESESAYLYVPNGIKSRDILIGNDAKIGFSSNLVNRNDLYDDSGAETAFTFTLYEAVYEDGHMEKKSILTEELIASVEVPLNSFIVPAKRLTKVTEKG
jgi:hypothetical protein